MSTRRPPASAAYAISTLTKGDRTRLQILEGAVACLVKRGFDGATVAELSAQAGVNKGLFHYYFGSKEVLIEECLRYVAIVGKDFTDRGVEADNTLERYLRVTFRWQETSSNHASYLWLSVQRAAYDAKFRKLVDSIFDSAHGRVLGLLEREPGMEPVGLERKRQLARSIHSTLVGMVFLASLKPLAELRRFEEDCVSAAFAMVAGVRLSNLPSSGPADGR